MKFNTDNYDIFHLGISGGKDSTAAMLWLLFESGIPRDKIRLSFCDTGNEDALTYAYIKMLSGNFHHIETIKPERDFWELARWKRRFPSTRARFCTQHLKIIPTQKYITSILDSGLNIVTMSGTRREEAHAGNVRGTQPQFEQLTAIGCDVYRPIIEWSIDDVWSMLSEHMGFDRVCALVRDDPSLTDIHKSDILERMAAHGIPRNPLYDMGASRVGCYPCVNSNKLEVRNIARYRPDIINKIEVAEFTSGSDSHGGFSSFFSRNKTPLLHRSKIVTTKTGEQVRVPTIHDVVRWSRTAPYRPLQYDIDGAI